MGVYAETNFTIECESENVAKNVLKVLQKKTKDSDENENTFGTNLSIDNNIVYGYEDSARIQNLEYRCKEIWEAIKNIEGVVYFNAPFMIEDEGLYYSK